MFWVFLLLWAGAAAPQQVQRGEVLFTDAAQGCSRCHALKGQGTAVGPDLSVLGRLSSQAMATAMRSSVTQYVQAVKLKSGGTFPGMPAGTDETGMNFFDMSKMPPELRHVDKADVQSVVSQDQWKHPPSTSKLTNAQIADVIAYVHYAVTGSYKPVDPDDVR